MQIFSIIVALLLLFGCATNQIPAPIEYKNGDKQWQKPLNSDEIADSATMNNFVEEELLVSDITTPAPQAIIYHEVQAGENLQQVASYYNQSAEQIAILNELMPPYELEEFQILKIRINPNQPEVKQVQLIDEQSKLPPAPVKTALYIKPVEGKILVPFGKQTKLGTNKGIIITGPKLGSKVVAAATGSVVYADYDATYGYLVIIKLSEQNTFTSYAHLEDIKVKKGQAVKQGQLIGHMGNSGKTESKQPQLHFSIRHGRKVQDPQKFIKF